MEIFYTASPPFSKAQRNLFKTESDEPVFMVVEVQPEFPGGPGAKKKFFAKELLIPKFKPAIKGNVIISFVVNVDGSLQDVMLIKSLHPEYDKEALRVIN